MNANYTDDIVCCYFIELNYWTTQEGPLWMWHNVAFKWLFYASESSKITSLSIPLSVAQPSSRSPSPLIWSALPPPPGQQGSIECIDRIKWTHLTMLSSSLSWLSLETKGRARIESTWERERERKRGKELDCGLQMLFMRSSLRFLFASMKKIDSFNLITLN